MTFDAQRDAPRLLSGIVHRVENGDGSLQVCLARRGQFDPPGASGEEADLEFTLKLPNLLGEWGLRNVQFLRGPAEVQFLGDNAEIPQVAEFHD